MVEENGAKSEVTPLINNKSPFDPKIGTYSASPSINVPNGAVANAES